MGVDGLMELLSYFVGFGLDVFEVSYKTELTEEGERYHIDFLGDLKDERYRSAYEQVSQNESAVVEVIAHFIHVNKANEFGHIQDYCGCNGLIIFDLNERTAEFRHYYERYEHKEFSISYLMSDSTELRWLVNHFKSVLRPLTSNRIPFNICIYTNGKIEFSPQPNAIHSKVEKAFLSKENRHKLMKMIELVTKLVGNNVRIAGGKIVGKHNYILIKSNPKEGYLPTFRFTCNTKMKHYHPFKVALFE